MVIFSKENTLNWCKISYNFRYRTPDTTKVSDSTYEDDVRNLITKGLNLFCLQFVLMVIFTKESSLNWCKIPYKLRYKPPDTTKVSNSTSEDDVSDLIAADSSRVCVQFILMVIFT